MTITFIQNIAWFGVKSLLVLTLPAVFVWLVASFGMWFAFSSALLATRTTVFIVGVFLLGLTCATCIERPQAATILVLFLTLFMVWQSGKQSVTWLGLLVALWIFVLYLLVDARVASSIWFVRLVLIAFGLCLPFAGLRLLGFRFVKITDGMLDIPMKIATGRNLDEWFSLLDRAKLEHVNHAEIMAILRMYGLTYSDQRTITVAYFQSRELPTIAISSDGAFVGRVEKPSFTDSWKGTQLEKFSIGHLLFATFVVACTVRMATFLQWQFPSQREILIGGVWTLSLAAILASFSVTWLSLGSRQEISVVAEAASVASDADTTCQNRSPIPSWILAHQRRRGLCIALIGSGTTVLLPFLFGGNPLSSILTIPGQTYFLCVLFVLYCVALFYLTLHALRIRGYRLVRHRQKVFAAGHRKT